MGKSGLIRILLIIVLGVTDGALAVIATRLGRSPWLAAITVGALVIVAATVFLAMRPWNVMPISSNSVLTAEYAALAARVPAGSTVESFGEVGAVAFFCDCTVVDRFSDRAQVADLLRAKRAVAGPVVRTLLDWNYYRLRTEPPIPATYEFAFAEDSAGIDVTSWLNATQLGRPPGVPTRLHNAP